MSKRKVKKVGSSGLAQSERSERCAKPDDLPSKMKSSRVVTGATRRRIDRSFKLKVLEVLNSLPQGEKGLYLRKMGLYSSQVSVWRKEMKNDKETSMTPKEEIVALKKENEKLKNRNETLEGLIELQKKIAKILKIESPLE